LGKLGNRNKKKQWAKRTIGTVGIQIKTLHDGYQFGRSNMTNPSKPPKNVICSADHAALEEGYTFVPSQERPTSWQERMVQRYHDGLYKEFALADLSQPGRLGLRWRTRQEVVDGRGERTCGNKRCLSEDSDFVTLEVPFSYEEEGVAKKELVKLRLCSSCRPLVGGKSESKEKVPDTGSAETKPRRKQESESSESDDTSDKSDQTRKRRKKRKKHKKHQHRRKKRQRSDS
jgi:protein FRA10AC1